MTRSRTFLSFVIHTAVTQTFSRGLKRGALSCLLVSSVCSGNLLAYSGPQSPPQDIAFQSSTVAAQVRHLCLCSAVPLFPENVTYDTPPISKMIAAHCSANSNVETCFTTPLSPPRHRLDRTDYRQRQLRRLLQHPPRTPLGPAGSNRQQRAAATTHHPATRGLRPSAPGSARVVPGVLRARSPGGGNLRAGAVLPCAVGEAAEGRRSENGDGGGIEPGEIGVSRGGGRGAVWPGGWLAGGGLGRAPSAGSEGKESWYNVG